MIKRSMKAIPAALLVLGSSWAMAAETITVQLKADIPTEDFYVRPVAGTDLSQVKTMAWSTANSTLEALKVDLDMKSTAKGIVAHLDAPAELFDGRNKIALAVKVGNTAVTANSPSTVGQAADVKAGMRQTMSIEPAAGSAFEAGSYTGTVSVVFEPAA